MVFKRIASFFGGKKAQREQEVYSDYDVSDYINEIVQLVTEGFTHVNKRIDSISGLASNNFSMVKSLSERHDAEISQVLARISDLSEDISSLREELSRFRKELDELKQSLHKTHGKKHESDSGGARDNIVTTPPTDVATLLPHPQHPQHHAITRQGAHSHPTLLTPENLSRALPPALLPVFNELLNAETFISYRELAKRLGKKESTARAYVNDLKKRGIEIEEQTSANGMKLIRLAKHIRQEYMIPE